MTHRAPTLQSFEADLLPMLAQAAREVEVTPRRAPVKVPTLRRGRLALAAAVGLSLALAVPLLSDDPLRGALAVDRRGDTIYVSVKDASADPETMSNDLRAQGLPAKVEVVPVSPSLEGTWVDFVNDSADGNDPRITQMAEQIGKHPRVLELPADFETAFIAVVGRPTEAGETYTIASAKDVGSAYGCLGLAGMTPHEVQEALTAKGLAVRWYYQREGAPTEELAGTPSDKIVYDAEFIGPTTVIVHTTDPGDRAEHRPGAGANGSTDC